MLKEAKLLQSNCPNGTSLQTMGMKYDYYFCSSHQLNARDIVFINNADGHES